MAVYVPFGHRLVAGIYSVDMPIANQLMPHRAETPIVNYLKTADAAVLNLTMALVLSAVVMFCSGNIAGMLISCVTALGCSLLLFLVLDMCPPLTAALHFDVIPYFSFRANNVTDRDLGFLEKPFRHAEDPDWRGLSGWPAYGVDVPSEARVWDTDEDGFRSHAGVRFADVVVLGSSFLPNGKDLQDTYASKLEKYLKGYTVANLGKGGYGPFEFLKVFERFGLAKKPQYAIFAFHTGDVEAFLTPYLTGIDAPTVAFQKAAFGSVWSRWWLALQEAGGLLESGVADGFQNILSPETVRIHEIHPDVAVLRLPGGVTRQQVFFDHHTGLPTAELLHSGPWLIFEQILRDFRQVSEQNEVVPILAYIPWATEVYAKYSTVESGRNWMAIRDRQIATSGNDEAAARKLAEKVGIELISFLPAFEDAARHGKLVYYQLDSHWNSEGSDIAARITAEGLLAQMRASGDNKHRRLPAIAHRAAAVDGETAR